MTGLQGKFDDAADKPAYVRQAVLACPSLVDVTRTQLGNAVRNLSDDQLAGELGANIVKTLDMLSKLDKSVASQLAYPMIKHLEESAPQSTKYGKPEEPMQHSNSWLGDRTPHGQHYEA